MMTWQIFCKQWHRWREELKSGRKKRGKNMPRNLLHNPLGNLLNTWPVLTVFIGPILGTKEIKDRRTLTCSGNSCTPERSRQWSPRDTVGRNPSQRPSVAPIAAHLFTGGSRKQETSVCKGIKILLTISPNHRSKDFLSQLKVWNLRLSHMSFLRVCFCCCGFQQAGLLVTSSALGFLHIQLPPRELSPS